MHPFDLTGKVALITGGNSGLGLGYARGIAKAGGDVVIWGRRAERNEAAAAELRGHGGRVLAQAVDVSDERCVVEAMAEAVQSMGRLDCVIANAGASTPQTSFHEMSSADWHELIDVAQHGAFYTLREAVRHMVARAERGDPGGSLIITGSLSPTHAVPRLQHYAAAKAAVTAMAISIAAEYGHLGIRANVLAAGSINTDLAGPKTAGQLEARAEMYAARNPIPRPGETSDLEGIVIYLMSDASAYHTGDVIRIDGGLGITMPVIELPRSARRA